MNIVDASSIEDLRMALAEMKTAIEFDQKELNEQQKKDIDRLASKAERMLVNDHLITSQQLLHVANLLIVWAISGMLHSLERKT